MDIQTINIREIIPYENNEKEHPKEQIEQIKKSITDFGNNDPIAIDENNVIVAGHGRYIALRELGYDTAEVIRIEHLTEDQKNAYRLVHNKLTLNSDFDFEILEKELNGILEDMTAYGFERIDECNMIEEEEKPEVEFTKSIEEHHNYIVLYFENDIDWLQAQSVLDIKPVKEYSTRKDGAIKKEVRGIGRVIDGASALSKLIGDGRFED